MGFAQISSFILLSLISSLCFGSKIINKNPLSAEAQISEGRINPGSNFLVEFNLKLAPKHHAYSDRFKLVLENNDNIKMTEPKLSGAISFFDKTSKKEKLGIQGQGLMTTLLELDTKHPLGPKILQFKLTYQACTEEYCLLPVQINIPLKINIQNVNDNKVSPSTTNESKVNYNQSLLERAKDKGWLAVFVFVFLGGLLTSFTPCIFPIIPITLAVIGSKSQGRSKVQGALLSLSYVLGIALTYASLGLIAARTGSLFGGYLGHPAVIIGISVLFFAMAASMFGLFEVEAPAFIRNRYQNFKGNKGFAGAFLSGIIAGVIAGPCVGPVLVTVLAYVAKSQDSVLGFFLLFTFAMGFGQLFLFLGTFSTAINRLPKSGPWMIRIKQSFGVIMVAMGIYYLSPLIKPHLGFIDSRTHSASVFQGYSESLLNKALSDKKVVVIDFWAEWCPACIELEHKTFSDPLITSLKDKVVFLKYNATETTDEVLALQTKYKILGLPHVVIYSRSGQHREDLTLTGFENAQDFRIRLDEALAEE